MSNDPITEQRLLLEEYDRKLAKYWEDEELSEQESARLDRIRKKLQRVREKLDSPKSPDSDNAPLVDLAAEVESSMVDHFLRWDGKNQFLLTAPRKPDKNKLRVGDIVPAEIDILEEYLTEWNETSENTLGWNHYLERREPKWRAEGETVRKAAARGETDVKKLQDTIIDAFRDRKKDRKDNFHANVNQYVTQLEDAETALGDIGPATDDLEAATARLEADVLAYQFKEESEKAKKTEQELKQLQKEIEETKASVKRWVSVVTDIVQKGPVEAASNAFAHILDSAIEETIDLLSESELKRLNKELAYLQAVTETLKNRELRTRIAEAQEKMEAAQKRFAQAQKKFNDALSRLKRAISEAVHELNEEKSTRDVGKLIVDRQKQVASIAKARNSCQKYLRGCKDATRQSDATLKFFRRVDSVSRALVRSDPEGALALTLGRFATGNHMSISAWRTWVQNSQTKCAKQLQWIEQEGMAPFEKAVSLIKKGLGVLPKAYE